jgi:hypothetical protein
MAESARKAQLYHLVSQQPQSPVVMPLSRRGARYRNHMAHCFSASLGAAPGRGRSSNAASTPS